MISVQERVPSYSLDAGDRIILHRPEGADPDHIWQGIACSDTDGLMFGSGRRNVPEDDPRWCVDCRTK